MRLNKAEFLELYGRALMGAMANPANAHTIWDSYERQQLMQGIAADLELTMSLLERGTYAGQTDKRCKQHD